MRYPHTDLWLSIIGDLVSAAYTNQRYPLYDKIIKNNPDIKVEPIYVLNVPVIFLGFNSKGLEMWKSKDGKKLYIMY